MMQKEAAILDRCGLHLNGVKLGVFNIAIYGKIRSGQVRRPRLLLFHATVPCNQYNLFPCGRMGLDNLGRPLV